MRHQFDTVRGPTLYERADHRPDPQTGVVWTRHDRVFCGGKQLEGSMMTRLVQSNGRQDEQRCTCFREECLRTHDFEWLRHKNEVNALASLVPA